jgi:hypothetical protein
VVPTMYSIFARKAVPGANTAVENTQPTSAHLPELVAK